MEIHMFLNLGVTHVCKKHLFQSDVLSLVGFGGRYHQRVLGTWLVGAFLNNLNNLIGGSSGLIYYILILLGNKEHKYKVQPHSERKLVVAGSRRRPITPSPYTCLYSEIAFLIS